MNYILGGAYKTLLFALYLKNILGEEITIVTYSNIIIKYCKAEKINYIEFEKMLSLFPIGLDQYPNHYGLKK